jgi:hypothetical protein
MLGDLLMEVNGTMTSVAVGKPVPEGSRVDAEVASEISGKVNGASLETHYVIIRPDGRSGYGEGRALLNTANGDAIQVHYPLGMGRSTSPGTFTVKGCVTFSTVSSSLQWLNDVLGVWEGTWDLANVSGTRLFTSGNTPSRVVSATASSRVDATSNKGARGARLFWRPYSLRRALVAHQTSDHAHHQFHRLLVG